MYKWRRLTQEEREEVLAYRISRKRPYHSPPHRYRPGKRTYSVSAACYEHQPHVALSTDRLAESSDRLLDAIAPHAEHVFAWCVLADHYHVLFRSEELKKLLRALALLHGRTSYEWNDQEKKRGRRVWCNYIDREMRDSDHFWATMNYIHHNPVKHGYVERWPDWPWSSAAAYLKEMGEARAREMWLEHNPLDRVEFEELPF